MVHGPAGPAPNLFRRCSDTDAAEFVKLFVIQCRQTRCGLLRLRRSQPPLFAQRAVPSCLAGVGVHPVLLMCGAPLPRARGHVAETERLDAERGQLAQATTMRRAGGVVVLQWLTAM